MNLGVLFVFLPHLSVLFPAALRYLDGLVGVGDQGDEEAEHHVDEERDEGVQVTTTEQPHQVALLLHVLKGGEHVVSVDQGEQTLRHRVQGTELQTQTFWIIMEKIRRCINEY